MADFFAAALFAGELADAEGALLLTLRAEAAARFWADCFLPGFIAGEFKLAGWGEKDFFKLHVPSRVHILEPVTDRIIHVEIFLDVPPDSPEWEAARYGQERAWIGAFKQLARVAAT